MSYSPEQVEDQAERVGIVSENCTLTRDMLRAYAATLKAAQRGVTEAMVDVGMLREAIEQDACERAIQAEMGVSEWSSFVPKHTAAALAKFTQEKNDVLP